MRHKNPEYFKRIIAFIDDYTANYGSSPSIKEISVGTELSDATICRYMQEMKANGELDYGGHRSIVTKRRKQTLSETVEIPVLGSISEVRRRKYRRIRKTSGFFVWQRRLFSSQSQRRFHD